MTAAMVLRRLRAGERLRTGYTFTAKAWFDNGDEVPAATMRRLRKAGSIEQDRDGFIRIAQPQE